MRDNGFKRWLLVFTVLVISACSSPDETSGTNVNESPALNAGPSPDADRFQGVVATENREFTKFQHSTPQHDRMPCLLCHKREDDSASLKFPGHLPCSGCHVQQFADNKNPICTVCHTETGLKSFPPLRSFNVRFDHAVHTRLTNCATCHKPSRRGVALSMPSGTSAHTTCFQCHAPETEVGGKNIGSCDTCHQPGQPRSTSDWDRAYSVSFSHSEHTRKGLSCSTCHNVRAGASAGRQVTSPIAVMHKASASGPLSCAKCHNDVRAFGGNDFSDCKRCHEGSSFKF